MSETKKSPHQLKVEHNTEETARIATLVKPLIATSFDSGLLSLSLPESVFPDNKYFLANPDDAEQYKLHTEHFGNIAAAQIMAIKQTAEDYVAANKGVAIERIEYDILKTSRDKATRAERAHYPTLRVNASASGTHGHQVMANPMLRTAMEDLKTTTADMWASQE